MTARIGFLGPPGTFTEEALRAEVDLVDADLVPFRSLPEVLLATEAGEVEQGFVPIENSIEGTVNLALDALVFRHSLLIQREVALAVEHNLMALPGTRLEDIRHVASIPHALAQCLGFLSRHLPGATTVPTNSTAEAAASIAARQQGDWAAIGARLAADLYGLEVLVPGIEDHPDNETRFVLVARSGPGAIPTPTGHDKTTAVCFQLTDQPGTLLAILQEFAVRGLNLTKLESRPTKRGLGDYCFVIDFAGHVADELVADCLRALRAKLRDVKFLGSYPAASGDASARRRTVAAAWQTADEWIGTVRSQLRDAQP